MLDCDVVAGRAVAVERRGRAAYVEGDAEVVSENGDAQGADFVGGVAVDGYAVASDEDDVDFAFGHKRSDHIVADESYVYSTLEQFVGS